MSYRTSIATSESENEQFDVLDAKTKPSASKCRASQKRGAEKTTEKKPKKKQTKMTTSYRENVGELFRLEDYKEEVTSSLTFRQGDGPITTKSNFEGKPTDYWVLTHYKSSNIVNVPLKDRWRHSEASVKVFMSDKSKDQTLNSSLNQTMQIILNFDTMLQDPDRRMIKSKIAV